MHDKTFFYGYPNSTHAKRKSNRLLGVTTCHDSVVVNYRSRNPPWVDLLVIFFTVKEGTKDRTLVVKLLYF